MSRPHISFFKHSKREYIAKGYNQCCWQYETCLHLYHSHYIEGHDCLSIIIQSYYSNIYVRFACVRVLKICLCYMTCPCFGSSLQNQLEYIGKYLKQGLRSVRDSAFRNLVYLPRGNHLQHRPFQLMCCSLHYEDICVSHSMTLGFKFYCQEPRGFRVILSRNAVTIPNDESLKLYMFNSETSCSGRRNSMPYS